MTQRVNTNDHVDRFIQSITSETRSNLRQSQTITYDAAVIKALVDSACGLQPPPGTVAAHDWRVQADRIFNHELDLLRIASGVSAGQTVTFKPIAENPETQATDDSGS